MRQDRFQLPLRIVMTAPPKDVAIAMQKGKADLVQPTRQDGEDLVFDFEVTVDGAVATGAPRLLGPFVQGPPTGRFVYINSGTYAGDLASPWARRAKVPLIGIDWPAIEALRPGLRLEARFFGQDRHGGPACATVTLGDGWRAV